MLIHEFMQRRTPLFSYLDSGYFHQTMELPTAQEKSKQTSLCNSRRISTSSKMNMTACHFHYAKSEEQNNDDDMNSSG
jgi:hypothetical protein